MFMLFAATIYLSIAAFIVFTLREYFHILNEILMENAEIEVLKLHMKLCEVISDLNGIVAVSIGYFIYVNVFCMTFALFELVDVLTAERDLMQIVFSIGFSAAVFHYMVMVFIFYLSSSLLTIEKEKSLKMILNNKNRLKSTRIFVKLLQLQSSQQKFTAGLFDFDMKAFFVVSFWNF